jgi:hypothetical protein
MIKNTMITINTSNSEAKVEDRAGATFYSKLSYSAHPTGSSRTYAEWVNLVHTQHCEFNGWSLSKLSPGTFGYDNLVISVDVVTANFRNLNVSQLAELVHTAWCDNYIYWRDTPIRHGYKMPFNKLGDHRRNQCAITAFADLPDDEKQKDIAIVRIILSLIA